MRNIILASGFLITGLSIILSVVGCGMGGDGVDGPYAVTEAYPLDGVKYIQKDFEDGLAPQTMGQEKYIISPHQRLLMRYEVLTKKTEGITADDKNRVIMVVRLVDTLSSAKNAPLLKLCPLVKNWMMMATWTKSDIFKKNNWSSQGGDFDPSGCVSGQVLEASKATEPLDGTVNFDVTDWYLNYPKGRQINYGLILISDSVSIEVHGDGSSYYAPKLQWLHTYYPKTPDKKSDNKLDRKKDATIITFP